MTTGAPEVRVLMSLFKIVRILRHEQAEISLFYVLSSFDESYPAHDMVSVFYPEDLSNLFRDRNASACNNFSKEGNVILLDLDRQRLASGKWLRTQSYNF